MASGLFNLSWISYPILLEWASVNLWSNPVTGAKVVVQPEGCLPCTQQTWFIPLHLITPRPAPELPRSKPWALLGVAAPNLTANSPAVFWTMYLCSEANVKEKLGSEASGGTCWHIFHDYLLGMETLLGRVQSCGPENKLCWGFGPLRWISSRIFWRFCSQDLFYLS